MTNQLPEHPIMTVEGIRISKGNFKDDSGKNVDYDNTVVTVLTSFSEKEYSDGAMGRKSTEYKIKGSQFYYDYLHMKDKLPAQAQMIFKLDVTRKTPVVQLIALNFQLDKSQVK